MPIYHKTPPSVVGNHATSDIDNHTSEAAKVKRTREHAYFNSYDFDAIEVLPYDEEDEEEEAGQSGLRQAATSSQSPHANSQQKTHASPLRQQHQPTKYAFGQKPKALAPEALKQSKLPANHGQIGLKSSNSDNFLVDNHRLGDSSSKTPITGHVGKIPTKYNSYLQRFGVTLFGGGGGAAGGVDSLNTNKSASSPHQQTSLRASSSSSASSATLSTTTATSSSLVADAAVDDSKHLKVSSSGLSSTSASASSSTSSSSPSSKTRESTTPSISMCSGSTATCSALAADSLNCESSGHRDPSVMAKSKLVDNNNGADVAVKDISMNGGAVTATGNAAVASCNGNVALVVGSSSTAAAASTVSADGNFLLPRAMLKYQSNAAANGICGNNSSHLAAATSGTNSMSLPTASMALSNSNAATATSTQTGSTPAPATALATTDNTATNRLKKHSTTSSSLSSLGSEEIVEIHHVVDPNDRDGKSLSKEFKVLPKTVGAKAPRRAASHQSHYSTDKSASSGYYSSNVCSTYSLEEHIYSEPTIELKEMPLDESLNAASHTATMGSNKPVEDSTLQHHASASAINTTTTKAAAIGEAVCSGPAATGCSVMRTLEYNRRYRYTDHNVEGVLQTVPAPTATNASSAPKLSSEEFNENLRILETSIENLDRHLKSFPGVIAHPVAEALVAAYSQSSYPAEKLRSSYSHLPTIREGYDGTAKRVWRQEDPVNDDSLLDIDLDSFLLDEGKKERKRSHAQLPAAKGGIDNPTFLNEELEENHYKCAKYINSCPEDAYRVESDIIAPARSCRSDQSVAAASSVDLYPKRYEDQIHFQNTRELLEDVRDKIRLLTLHTAEPMASSKRDLSLKGNLSSPPPPHQLALDEYIPKELHTMIGTLKRELELYLQRMNQHSELEIRQLCTGLVKNQHIVKMKNAFERRRSLTDASEQLSTYETLQGEMRALGANGGVGPISIRQQVTTIKCASDPNFKMKRKSLTEVFPISECYIESLPLEPEGPPPLPLPSGGSQLQRNLNFHQPSIQQFQAQSSDSSSSFEKAKLQDNTSASSSGRQVSRTSSGNESNDKDSILDWHRKKPSIWEMYYGTNRIQQYLLGCNGKNKGLMVTGNGASSSTSSPMCYPSSRPESDFTLDLPRAEQLRIKMEKEKKYRQKCRVITTFLSLVFFLLTLMVVSLILTRGKRMFGSMI
ncbi:serine-rich adhesin for platelets [Stomoxys calcitrans]|uniref:serine-rich adhesin for platelets n=1 Tax=Stomoxys calcitrans TaxID=35570 RepID=UPI0027E33BCE|nr:serine-rich adhesin for platelets [Stomoxys calcitrans]